MIDRSCSKDQWCWDNSEQTAAQGNHESKKKKKIIFFFSEAKRASISVLNCSGKEKRVMMLPSGFQRLNWEESKEIILNCSETETLVIKVEASPKFINCSSSVHPRPSFASEPSHSNGECFRCEPYTVLLWTARSLPAPSPASLFQKAYSIRKYHSGQSWSTFFSDLSFFFFSSPSIWGFFSFFLSIHEGNIYSQGSAE